MQTPINLLVEDPLGDVVLRKILEKSSGNFCAGVCYGLRGYNYIKDKISGFNKAARGTPFLVLVDLEAECPPLQIVEWLPAPRHPNLLFRIAVKETESWLICDRIGLASFFSVSSSLITRNTDEIEDPKQFIINLARRSRRRTIRESIAPKPASTAKVGPDYNGQLALFVNNYWDIDLATQNSESLRHTLNALNNFSPT